MHISFISGSNDDIINQVPMLGGRMLPGDFVPILLAKRMLIITWLCSPHLVRRRVPLALMLSNPFLPIALLYSIQALKSPEKMILSSFGVEGSMLSSLE